MIQRLLVQVKGRPLRTSRSWWIHRRLQRSLTCVSSCRWRCTPGRLQGSPGPQELAGGCSLAWCPGHSSPPWWPCLQPARWWKTWGCTHTVASATPDGVKERRWLVTSIYIKKWSSSFYLLSLIVIWLEELCLTHLALGALDIGGV